MKKVYIETMGCQMNVSDSERAATNLSSKGFKVVNNESDADVVIVNTCSVREKAEHKLYTRIGQLRKSYQGEKKIGVMGCVAQLEGETLFAKADGVDFIIGTRAVGRISEAIKNVSTNDEQYIDISERDEEYNWNVDLRQRISNHIAYVPIIEGCNKFCTYCIVPFSRGREKSLPADEIIKQILDIKDSGIKEVQLIGQNVNSYRPKSNTGLENLSGSTPFVKLLRAVAATSIERIKFTTSFPRDFHPEIINVIEENENLCNWVHLPVQSGSNRVLKMMRRGHTIEDYKKRIDIIRNSNRNISITTDIIIGFPGETDEDFEETYKLFEYCQFDSAYLFKYSKRLGTPASRINADIDEKIIQERFLKLDALQRSTTIKSLKNMIGQTLSVLAEKPSLKNVELISGHSTCNRVVNFISDGKLGNIYNVKVNSSTANSLVGVDSSKVYAN